MKKEYRASKMAITSDVVSRYLSKTKNIFTQDDMEGVVELREKPFRDGTIVYLPNTLETLPKSLSSGTIEISHFPKNVRYSQFSGVSTMIVLNNYSSSKDLRYFVTKVGDKYVINSSLFNGPTGSGETTSTILSIPQNVIAIPYDFINSSYSALIETFDLSKTDITHLFTKTGSYITSVILPIGIEFIDAHLFHRTAVVTYPGTIEQWNNVVKAGPLESNGWYNILVQCSDGEVYA